ncbi:MAG: carbon dioxide concentrating mechanism protein CcmL [Planctomycetaceae bacterium]|nr:carbon dioxide concentrating mechanism protein CcmL [Planctomycetaceae bacterium]
MRMMETIGKVTLSRWHPMLEGASWKLAVPLMAAGLADRTQGRTEPIVVFDELGAGNGMLIAVSESAEASAPFHPHSKPLDAYNSAILDSINL